jgi:hypothetical protein
MVHTAPDGAGIRYAATGDGPTILATHGYVQMVSHPDAFLAGVEPFLAGLGQAPT